MPYALTGLVNGQRPDARYVPEGYVAKSGEVVWADSRWELVPPDHVWDTASQSMRLPTANENFAKRKAQKEKELRDTADAEITTNTRASEREIVVYKAATGAVLNAEEVQIRDNMQANYNKLKSLLVTLRGAQTNTVEEVDAIIW